MNENDSIDVVIPAHIKDTDTLEICIDSVKKNIIGLNNVYVVSRTKLTNNAIWYQEDKLPFNLEFIASKIGKHRKTCWYYADLLQGTLPLLIPELLNNVLILDSDTIFLRPIKLVKNGISQFNTSPSDGMPSYYEYIQRLLPNLNRQYIESGVTHFILIRRDILKDLFNRVEKLYNKPFWEAAIDTTLQNYININRNDHAKSQGKMANYELYFTFVLKYHREKCNINKLNSIMSYKGWLGIKGYTEGKPSRTNKTNRAIQIINPNIEKTFNFKSITESINHISHICANLGYDTITFQNHQRIGSENNSKINRTYVNSI